MTDTRTTQWWQRYVAALNGRAELEPCAPRLIDLADAGEARRAGRLADQDDTPRVVGDVVFRRHPSGEWYARTGPCGCDHPIYGDDCTSRCLGEGAESVTEADQYLQDGPLHGELLCAPCLDVINRDM